MGCAEDVITPSLDRLGGSDLDPPGISFETHSQACAGFISGILACELVRHILAEPLLREKCQCQHAD